VWRIIGETGSVTWDGAEGFEAQVVTETSGLLSKVRDLEIPPYAAPPGGSNVQVGGHSGLIQDFVHAVRTGRTPETICDDNIKSLAMVFGAVESAERGEKVRVES
jgi:predicted dehydrogenase